MFLMVVCFKIADILLIKSLVCFVTMKSFSEHLRVELWKCVFYDWLIN